MLVKERRVGMKCKTGGTALGESWGREEAWGWEMIVEEWGWVDGQEKWAIQLISLSCLQHISSSIVQDAK